MQHKTTQNHAVLSSFSIFHSVKVISCLHAINQHATRLQPKEVLKKDKHDSAHFNSGVSINNTKMTCGQHNSNKNKYIVLMTTVLLLHLTLALFPQKQVETRK